MYRGKILECAEYVRARATLGGHATRGESRQLQTIDNTRGLVSYKSRSTHVRLYFLKFLEVTSLLEVACSKNARKIVHFRAHI